MREIVHALSFGEPSHAAQLDIDDAAGLHFYGLLRLVGRSNAFVQADGRLKLNL